MSLKVSRPTPKNFHRPFTADYKTDFLAFLAANSLELDPKRGLVADGTIGRAFINVGNARKLVGWYQLWLDQSVPFGRIGDYRASATEPTDWQRSKRLRTITKLPNELSRCGTRPSRVSDTLT